MDFGKTLTACTMRSKMYVNITKRKTAQIDNIFSGGFE